jgi:hypothetical protein
VIRAEVTSFSLFFARRMLGSDDSRGIAAYPETCDCSRVTLVLYRKRAHTRRRVERNRVAGRAFDKAVRRKPLARRTRAYGN